MSQYKTMLQRAEADRVVTGIQVNADMVIGSTET
jgi:hypothetical protein